jgi:cytochrome c oxidase assembly protein subunit 15
MSSSVSEPQLAPRWLHGWAILTAAATVCLLALGAVVTTLQVGMADPIWPTYPWHLLLIDWQEPRPGFLIEHTHRLAGYIVGCCVIVLAVGLWRSSSRRWLGWLGMAALAGVIVQGLLGGFRVLLHALLGTNLAVIHGCFAQVVFCVLVSLAVLTARRSNEVNLLPDQTRRLRPWSLLLTGLIFLQLVWGALVRHTNGTLAQRGHFLTAFAVVAAAVWLARTALESEQTRRLLGRSLLILGVLIVIQLLLGVESWLGKFAGVLMPELQRPTVGQAVTRIAHVLVGSFILADSVVIALLIQRAAPSQVLARATDTLSFSLPPKRQGDEAMVLPHLEGTA